MKGNRQSQETFFDLAMRGRGGCNRVLETIDREIDFSEAEQRVKATYSKIGRPAHRAEVLLRVMILQHLYGLSDPQAEEQLKDRLSFQRFCGVGGEESVPDETTICRFRQRLIDCDLHEELLEMMNRQLEEKGYILKRTTLVDATLVESSRSRPSVQDAEAGTAPDEDASYTRKAGRSVYGYKAHISADGAHHLIRGAIATSAKVSENHLFERVTPQETSEVYADRAYDTKAAKQWMKHHRIGNRILKKGAHHIKLTDEDRLANREKEAVRCGIERIFAHLKQWQGYRRVRYLGLEKNQLELTLKAVAYNLKRLASLAEAPAT